MKGLYLNFLSVFENERVLCGREQSFTTFPVKAFLLVSATAGSDRPSLSVL